MPSTEPPIPTLQTFSEILPELDSLNSVAFLKLAPYHPSYVEEVQTAFTDCFFVAGFTAEDLTGVVNNYSGAELGLVNFGIGADGATALANQLEPLALDRCVLAQLLHNEEDT